MVRGLEAFGLLPATSVCLLPSQIIRTEDLSPRKFGHILSSNGAKARVPNMSSGYDAMAGNMASNTMPFPFTKGGDRMWLFSVISNPWAFTAGFSNRTRP